MNRNNNKKNASAVWTACVLGVRTVCACFVLLDIIAWSSGTKAGHDFQSLDLWSHGGVSRSCKVCSQDIMRAHADVERSHVNTYDDTHGLHGVSQMLFEMVQVSINTRRIENVYEYISRCLHMFARTATQR